MLCSSCCWLCCCWLRTAMICSHLLFCYGLLRGQNFEKVLMCILMRLIMTVCGFCNHKNDCQLFCLLIWIRLKRMNGMALGRFSSWSYLYCCKTFDDTRVLKYNPTSIHYYRNHICLHLFDDKFDHNSGQTKMSDCYAEYYALMMIES